MEARTFTYQTRINPSTKQAAFLRDFGCLYGKVERSLHAEYARGNSIMNCKTAFLTRFGITARQFNSVRVMLQGKHKSLLALQGDYIQDTLARIKKTSNRIKVLTKKKALSSKQALAHFQKKRLLIRQKEKLRRLQADKQAQSVRLCFGSKRLLKQQHRLDENGYESHKAWLEAWQLKRSNQFFLVGSKDETAGNQSAVASIGENGCLSLRIRVPDSLVEKHGKFITLSDIAFSYGDAPIKAALLDNYKRQSLQKVASRKEHGNLYQRHGVAVNYRFLKDEKGWRLFISLERKFKEKSAKCLGAIGIDINASHLSVCEIGPDGNRLQCFDVSCCTYGKSQNQAKAIIGDACKAVVTYALSKQKPIIIENLDFAKKKQSLASQSKRKARMLSGFAYVQIRNNIQSSAFRQGIQVHLVNPAYSSVIGRVKYARLYTISIHQSAALVIARRFYGYCERLPHCWENIPNNTGSRITLQGLVKNPVRHDWKAWAIIQRQLNTALAAHFQKLAKPQGARLTRPNASPIGIHMPMGDALPF